MVDILANGDYGRDDGVKCEWLDPEDGEPRGCGGKTYLIDDQGGGLCAYKCKDCEEEFQVQYDVDDDEDFDEEGW